jgi:hypothetical protein
MCVLRKFADRTTSGGIRRGGLEHHVDMSRRGMRLRIEQLQAENERLLRELAATRAVCAGYVAAQVAAVAAGRQQRDELGIRRMNRTLGGGLV